ncbi:hypothetical protein K439DRAFT_1618250 [Ramaria rubella]|nr:hypothetical protein K439DRAFT_1618250 [Ramaria rubella]
MPPVWSFLLHTAMSAVCGNQAVSGGPVWRCGRAGDIVGRYGRRGRHREWGRYRGWERCRDGGEGASGGAWGDAAGGCGAVEEAQGRWGRRRGGGEDAGRWGRRRGRGVGAAGGVGVRETSEVVAGWWERSSGQR